MNTFGKVKLLHKKYLKEVFFSGDFFLFLGETKFKI